MKRAHPYQVQVSLGAAQALAKAGVEFVPVPSLSTEDHCELADQMVSRMQQLAHMCVIDKCVTCGTEIKPDARLGTTCECATAQPQGDINEELLAAVAILRNQGLSNLAQAVATAHDQRIAAVPAPIVVELPNLHNGKYWKSYPEEEGECFEHGAYMLDVRIALEAQGVQVKP